MWISAFLLVIGIINYRSLGNYVMFLCSNKYGLLYTILCSISWGIFQIFAFRLVKYFRQHMLPISIFIFHSLAFYEFDMIKNMTSFVSIVLLIVTTMLAIYWQVKNREKVKVTEEMGSEIGLKVINNQSMTLHDYEVMQK